MIRTRELGGRIVALGGDHARGITVEAPSFTADGWGPSGGQFTLKRNPRVQWPDLRAYAPLIVEANGVPVWRGRIKGTPMTDGGLARQISINAEGAQFRLDDDSYERFYVITDLARFVDARSLPNAQLGAAEYCANGQVTNDKGGVYLGHANGSTIPSASRVGAILDTGPGQVIKGVVLVVQSANNTAAINFYARATDGTVYGSSEGAGNLEDISGSPITMAAGAVTNFASALTGSRRFFSVLLYYPGVTTAIAVDHWFRVKQIMLFSDDAYRSGAVSILKASTIILDALDRATMQLSADRSLVQATTFNIPEFAMTTPATPREVITAANAYHAYQFRVRADNRCEYRPLPSEPLVEVGSDSRFDEASAADGSEIYTGVTVAYLDPTGVQKRLYRAQPAATLDASTLQLANGSFGTDLSGWFPNTGVITRDTTVFDTLPASLKITPGAGAYVSGPGTTTPFVGAVVPGRSYRLVFAVRRDGAYAAGLGFDPVVQLTDGVSFEARVWVPEASLPINTWTQYAIDFQPTTKTTLANLLIQVFGFSQSGAGSVWLDSFTIYESTPTLVDRWGFRRTKVIETNMMLTDAAAQQIGDTFLLAHKLTPLKGKLVVSGDGRARRSPSGAGMTAAELLTMTGELVRMRHLVDPDSGKLGRVGRIASVSYDADANVATLDIDSTSANFEALLARLAIVTGQVRG